MKYILLCACNLLFIGNVSYGTLIDHFPNEQQAATIGVHRVVTANIVQGPWNQFTSINSVGELRLNVVTVLPHFDANTPINYNVTVKYPGLNGEDVVSNASSPEDIVHIRFADFRGPMWVQLYFKDVLGRTRQSAQIAFSPDLYVPMNEIPGNGSFGALDEIKATFYVYGGISSCYVFASTGIVDCSTSRLDYIRTVNKSQVPLLYQGRPGQNPTSAMDVNNDGWIAPNDILTLVQYLNDDLGHPGLSGYVGGRYPDVDGDGHVSPRDLLIVRQYINSNGSGPAP